MGGPGVTVKQRLRGDQSSVVMRRQQKEGDKIHTLRGFSDVYEGAENIIGT